MTQAGFRKYALVAIAVTLGVILWGAYVRASGSGAGCGAHWPMCNGEIIPRSKSVATFVEFTHRITSGLALTVVVVELGWALWAYPRGHRVRLGAYLTVGFMLSEAAVGAGLVLFELVARDASVARAAFVAVHLTNTFLLVASMTLTAWWAHGGPALRLRGQGLAALAVVAGLAGAIGVGISGAIAALGDTLFPSATFAEGVARDLAPGAHLFIRLRVIHPMLAGAVAGYLLLVASTLAARRSAPAVRRAAGVVTATVLLQVTAGFANLALLAPTWMQIVHLALADAVWIALVVLAAAELGSAPQTVTERALA